MSGGGDDGNDKGIENHTNRVGGNGTTVRNDGPHNAENGPTKVTSSGSAATTTVTEDNSNSKPSSKIEYKVKSEYADGYQKLTRNMEIAVESRRVSEVEGSWCSRRSSEDRGIHAFMQSAVVISSGVTCKDKPAENEVDQFVDKALHQHVPKKRKTKVKRAKSMEVFYRGRDFDLSNSDTESCASSLESLIKHNLAAAKALQPVPVAKAKERYCEGVCCRPDRVAFFGFRRIMRCIFSGIICTVDPERNLYWGKRSWKGYSRNAMSPFSSLPGT